MEQRHRDAIQRNFISLVEQTDLDLMVSILYEKEVFSEQMIEQYRDPSKSVRERKRQLYMDLPRRGPRAFGRLLDALTEAGNWDLVRELDPNSILQPHNAPRVPPMPLPSYDTYLSLSAEKKKTKAAVVTNKKTPLPEPEPRPEKEDPYTMPQFTVIKSTKFIECNGKDLKLYRTRRRSRGVLLIFNYIAFANDIEPYRDGVDVDCAKLKYLFTEIGFKVIVYPNYTKEATQDVLDSLKDMLGDTECVFVVVSSHGYKGSMPSDTEIRCSDGALLSLYDFIEHFNNKKLPALDGIPKVFIFQVCRGQNNDWVRPPKMRVPAPWADWADVDTATDTARSESDSDVSRSEPPGSGRAHEDHDPRHDTQHSEYKPLYCDILIAHSTLPGFVAHRDKRLGSWYIQALCKVFAQRAHDCHVDKLFTLVDREMNHQFGRQTSSVDRWGFNRRLYLHPGLFED